MCTPVGDVLNERPAMPEREAEVYRAATMYYVQGETMDNIARHLATSRSTVSRMLREARETGMVRITLTEPDSPTSTLAASLSALHGVHVHVVPVRAGATDVARLERVGRGAAALLDELVTDGSVVGVAWGTTTAAVAGLLPRHPHEGVEVVQLNGAANPITSGIPYAGSILDAMATAWQATVQPFPVPAFFDRPETRRLLWQERAIRRVLDLQARADVAVFGVGTVRSGLPSHVYTAGYLDEDDFAALAHDGVAGDVCTVFLRPDGTWRDVALNQRASGPTPDQLQRIARRVCVVASTEKAPALRAALRAGVATDVVVDDRTARALLAAGA